MLLIVLHYAISVSAFITLPKASHDPIFDCLNDLIKGNFEEHQTFHVLYNENLQFSITTNPHFVHYSIGNSKVNFNYNNFVIPFEEFQEIDAILRKFRFTYRWLHDKTPRGVFIMLPLKETQIDAIFHHLWALKIVNVYVITYFHKSPRVIGSYPYTKHGKCGRNVFVTYNGTCNGSLPNYDRPNEISDCSFDVLVGTHVYGEPYVSDDLQRGIVLYPMQLFEEIYQIKANYTKIQLYNQTEIIVPKSVIEAIYARNQANCNVQISNYDRHFPLYEAFKLTDVFFSEKHVWVLPKPKLTPRFLVILNLLKPFTWTVTLLFIITSGYLWCKISKRRQELHGEDTSRSFLLVFMLFFGAIPARPKSSTLRIFAVFLIIFNMHLNIYLQGQLSCYLTLPVHERKIDTIQKLLASNVEPYVQVYTFEQLKKNPLKIARELSKRAIPDKTYSTNLNIHDLIYNRSHALLIAGSDLRLTEAEKQNVQHFQDEVTWTIEIAYVHEKGDPFLPTMNNLIRKTFESGLIYKVLNDMKKVTFITNNNKESMEMVVLKFSHVEAAFYSLFFGLTLATMILLIEVVDYNIKRKYRMKRHPVIEG